MTHSRSVSLSFALKVGVAAAALPLLTASAAFSQQSQSIAKEGTVNFTNTWLVTSSSKLKVGDRSLEIYELSGVTRSEDGGDAFNNMGFHCVGADERIGSELRGRGACTYTDKDGDQMMTTYLAERPRQGTATVVAGSGKFAGISGASEWTVQVAKAADDKFPRGIGSEKLHWRLSQGSQ